MSQLDNQQKDLFYQATLGFKIGNLLTVEQILLAHQMGDIERMKLALGTSIEQLQLIKNLDFSQLKDCLKYIRGKVPEEVTEPSSILTMDLSMCPTLNPIGPLHVLLIADDQHPANAVRDYINAFTQFSRHKITVWNSLNTQAQDCKFSINSFDVIVIHYSVCILFEYFMPHYLLEKISQFKGLKVQIIQDENRWINRMANRIERLGIDIIISSLTPENIKKVYHHHGLKRVKKYHSLPGYIPHKMLDIQTFPIQGRQYDVVYRGRALSFSHGAITQEKSNIALQFTKIAKKHDLRFDLCSSEEKRLYGNDWIQFVSSSKAVLGVEGGGSIFDFDELATYDTKRYLAYYPEASFKTVATEVLQPYEGNIIHRTITPRIFEAICLRTALILYPGSYSTILTPWAHYIPFERDNSNVDKVIAALKDEHYLTEMIERAYTDVALNPDLQFKKFIEKVDFIIASSCAAESNVR